MKKALCASLRQAMLSRGFLIGASGTALVLLLSSVQGILSGFRSAELLSPGFHSDLIMGALSSDAMALALPILCALLFLPMEAYPDVGAEVPNYFGNLMETALMFFASGAFWSLVGLTFAALTNSKYMAYASPFVLFYLLIILYERYFDKLFVLYPREWLNPSSKWMFGKIGVAVLLIEFSVLMALAFAYAAKRRLERI